MIQWFKRRFGKRLRFPYGIPRVPAPLEVLPRKEGIDWDYIERYANGREHG